MPPMLLILVLPKATRLRLILLSAFNELIRMAGAGEGRMGGEGIEPTAFQNEAVREPFHHLPQNALTSKRCFFFTLLQLSLKTNFLNLPMTTMNSFEGKIKWNGRL